MSDFVNYKKRGASLPAGCKDLIDALEPERRSKGFELSKNPKYGGLDLEELRRSAPRRDEGHGRMVDFEKWFARVYESKALAAILRLITPDDFELRLNWNRSTGKEIWACVTVERGAALEGKVRAFLRSEDMADPEACEAPQSLVTPGIAVTQVCPFEPTPKDAGSMAALAKDFFKQVLELDETTDFRFKFLELIASAKTRGGDAMQGEAEAWDAIDPRLREMYAQFEQALSRDDKGQGRMEDFERWFGRVYESKALEASLLVIAPGSFLLSVEWQRWIEWDIKASVMVEAGTALEKKVREFFEARSMEDAPDREVPASFNPGLPISLICDFKPMPKDASSLAVLARDFFREVLGLDETAVFRFEFAERVKKPEK